MAQVSPHIKQLVSDRIMSDLRPSLFTIYAKSGIAVAAGGFLSLFLCGQFGVAVTSSARHVNNHLHSHAEGIGCAVLCGVIFAVAPALMLRLLCSPLQFRAIIRRGFHAPLLWLVTIGGFLAYHGDHGKEILSFMFWCISVAAMFAAVGAVIDLVSAKFEKGARALSSWGLVALLFS